MNYRASPNGKNTRCVRTAAMKALASFSQTENLPLLREVPIALDDTVAEEVVRGLLGLTGGTLR